MASITQQKQKELKETLRKNGFQACLDEAGRNVHGILICEGLDPNFYGNEAKAISQELEGGYIDVYYVEEKIRHLVELMRVINRFGGEDNRFGNAKDSDFWSGLHRQMMTRK